MHLFLVLVTYQALQILKAQGHLSLIVGFEHGDTNDDIRVLNQLPGGELIHHIPVWHRYFGPFLSFQINDLVAQFSQGIKPDRNERFLSIYPDSRRLGNHRLCLPFLNQIGYRPTHTRTGQRATAR